MSRAVLSRGELRERSENSEGIQRAPERSESLQRAFKEAREHSESIQRALRAPREHSENTQRAFRESRRVLIEP